MKKNWIDISRAIAILLVIMIHTGQYFNAPYELKKITNTGDMGVILFFILSSLTLFNSFELRYINDGNNRNKFFFIRRFFRIAPVYYIFTIIYTIIEICVKGYNSVAYWKIIVSILFLNSIILPGINYIPNGGWSIGTEMLFYCMIPFLFNYIKTIKNSFYLLVGTIILSNIINIFDSYIIDNFTKYDYINLRGWFFYFWLPNQLPVFCFGILLYNIFKAYIFSKNASFIFLISSILLFLILSQVVFKLNYPNYFFQREYIYASVFSIFIIGIKDLSFNGFFSKIFCLIGKYSFSMYLSHFLILKVFFYFVKKEYNNINSIYFFIISYIFICFTTFLISKFTYKIEKFGISYGNKLITNYL